MGGGEVPPAGTGNAGPPDLSAGGQKPAFTLASLVESISADPSSGRSSHTPDVHEIAAAVQRFPADIDKVINDGQNASAENKESLFGVLERAIEKAEDIVMNASIKDKDNSNDSYYINDLVVLQILYCRMGKINPDRASAAATDPLCGTFAHDTIENEKGLELGPEANEKL